MAILVATRLGRATMAIVISAPDNHTATNITPWSAPVMPRWPSPSVSPSPSAGVSGNSWHVMSECEAALVEALITVGRADVGQLHATIPARSTEAPRDDPLRLRADFLFWLLAREDVLAIIENKRVIVRGVIVGGPYFAEHYSVSFDLLFNNCIFDHCHFDGLKAISVSFSGCTFDSLSCKGMSLQADFFVSDCLFKYNLCLEGASLGGSIHILKSEELVLLGSGLEVHGSLRLASRADSKGPIRAMLDRGTIGAVEFSGPGFQFISLEHALVRTDVFIDVDFVDAEEGSNGASLEQLSAGGSLSWFPRPSQYTRLALANAKVRTFRDTESSLVCYPLLDLAGFTYDQVDLVEKGDGWVGLHRGSQLPHRLRWLARQAPWRFSFQPYVQFAAILDRQGNSADATEALVQGVEEQRRRRSTGLAARFRTILLRITVGHGYRPGRSLYWIAVFVLVGAVVFDIAKSNNLLVSERAVGVAKATDESAAAKSPGTPKEVTTFNAVAYSIDAFLPIVDLRQEKYWIASGVGLAGTLVQVYSWLHIACGWAFTTLAVAAFSGALKKRT